MNPSRLFILRPVATSLLMVAILIAGLMAYRLLPTSALPEVDYPTIQVTTLYPGASPDVMTSNVTAPLERQFGQMPGLSQMSSTSSGGASVITLRFALDMSMDVAEQQVQAAINASRADLPSTLRSNPTYRKANPSDAPVIILALTSRTKSPGQIYDAVSNIVQQKLAQVKGVGDVEIGGGSLPAVRVDLLPFALNRYGVSSEDIRAAIQASSANRPKGTVEDGARSWTIGANDQARTAADYAPLIVRYRNGAAVRLQDLGEVVDSVQDIRNYGVANGKPSILLLLFKQPNANIIESVDKVRALLPHLRASIPAAIDLNVVVDRTPTIRASLREVERALAIAVGLVILVVSRDFMIVGAVIISWLVDNPVPMKPLMVSKLNTVAQVAFAALVLASLGFGFSTAPYEIALMLCVTVLTLLSVSFYLVEWARHMNAGAPPSP